LSENSENINFVTYIFHSYLSDMESSANDQSNLTKIPKLGVSDH